MHLSDDQSTYEGRMNMLPAKSTYDMSMSVASSSYSAMPAAYSSMAAYTPQMAAPMHAAMHPHMYSGKHLQPLLLDNQSELCQLH